MQLTEILALRKEDEFLREQLRLTEAQKLEAEDALEAVRLKAASKKAEQERYGTPSHRLGLSESF